MTMGGAQSEPIGIANRKMALFGDKTLWHTWNPKDGRSFFLYKVT
jgi:hypothetical protein